MQIAVCRSNCPESGVGTKGNTTDRAIDKNNENYCIQLLYSIIVFNYCIQLLYSIINVFKYCIQLLYSSQLGVDEIE